MGRIETDTITLYDLQDTISATGKSRATVFRLLKKGSLEAMPVAGTKNLYVTKTSIDNYVKTNPLLAKKIKVVPADNIGAVRAHLMKRFPHIIK